jgi:serine-type D-Ala-D-Ala carboxypeptidase/endopeptidase
LRRIDLAGSGARFIVAALMLAAASCTRAPPAASPAKPLVDPNIEARRVQAAADAVYAQSLASGMVMSVVHGDQAGALAFGRQDPEDARPADARTLVRLQSVSKLFAASLLSSLVNQGRIKLADPLGAYAPPGWKAPRTAAGDPPITLLNLATHTSGLPREAAIKPGQPAPQAEAARWAWLAKQRRLPPPGRGALYSNIAFDLLGDALSSAAKVPYGAALHAEVTGPLRLGDTTATPSMAQCQRMMAGDPNRRPYPCVDQSGEAASGGLYSTANDMALWLRAEVAPGAELGRRAISQAVYVRRDALASAVGLDHAGLATGVGLAWIEQDASPGRPRLLEKTGGGDGFLTYVVIDPVHRAAVFVGFNNVSGRRLGAVAEAADQLVFLLGTEPDSIAIPGTPPVAGDAAGAPAH